jgi:hypothetical protein
MGVDEVQDEGEVGETGFDARLQCFAAITQSNLMLNVAALSRYHLLHQAVQSGILAVQSRPNVLVLGFRGFRDTVWGVSLLAEKAGNDILRRARGTGDGVDGSHDGLFLTPTFLALAQAYPGFRWRL